MPNSKSKYQQNGKYVLLAVSIFFDLIGLLTFSLPIIGEVFDLIWAPLSAIILWVLYRKSYGSVGALLSFFEEILPGLDVVPSFTLMWIVKYYVLRKISVPEKIIAR